MAEYKTPHAWETLNKYKARIAELEADVATAREVNKIILRNYDNEVDRNAALREALEAADKILGVIEEMGKLGGCWYEWEIDGEIIQVASGVIDARALIRKAKGEPK